jgi:hypothetical protein
MDPIQVVTHLSQEMVIDPLTVPRGLMESFTVVPGIGKVVILPMSPPVLLIKAGAPRTQEQEPVRWMPKFP